MLCIPYDTEAFPPGTVANGHAELSVTWDDILWAAVTVGRPNRHYVFRYSAASMYEALFRWSLVRMALEQSGRRAARLRRTTAARTLDPTEKGAVNYFLGMTFCKLFAAKLLNTPWLLHLDVFRPVLNPVLTGRSRPDLVGEAIDGSFVALECKGRTSAPDARAKDKAKEQARRLVSVNGTAPAFQIGGISYIKNEILQFYWRDPEPDLNVKNPIKVTIQPELWRYYYTPILDLIRSVPNRFEQMMREPVFITIESADIKIAIHPKVLRALSESHWEKAQNVARHLESHVTGLPYKADGIAVVAGQSWLPPFEETGEYNR
jgi:hypothetical protein